MTAVPPQKYCALISLEIKAPPVGNGPKGCNPGERTIHLDRDHSSPSPPLPIRKLTWVDVACITCSGNYFEGASQLGWGGADGGRRQQGLPSKCVLSGVRGKAEA